ncbi:TetR/AcrR family transcriptional regulator [Rhodococcus rhodnii]|uniref:Transcriptional regulator n=2 Tax=Rhodococcus rhodnii TaxID=38312 RepID=R7WTR8_9NOCA|nr:TetR/AcrR family transcriptional regulator [Rhodococcus rhodnii]EOM77544.1 transcriptional regulator [Rhodococcus rhodnii LMG 5362]TXG89409.1 TetR/AcrR family transcriptional regulator [Rhodococcus rhodnii]
MTTRRYSSTNPELLAQAVFDVAADAGLDNASVREVAKRAGVSIGAVQHHFSTKDEMLVFTLRAASARLVERVTDVASIAAGGPHDVLVAMLSEMLPLDERRSKEAHVRAAFAVRAVSVPGLADIRSRGMFAIRSAVAAVLLDAGAPDAEIRAGGLVASAEGFAASALADRQSYPTAYLQRSIAQFVDLALRDRVEVGDAVELAS